MVDQEVHRPINAPMWGLIHFWLGANQRITFTLFHGHFDPTTSSHQIVTSLQRNSHFVSQNSYFVPMKNEAIIKRLTPKITFVSKLEVLYRIDFKCVWNRLNMCIETTSRNEGQSICLKCLKAL